MPSVDNLPTPPRPDPVTLDQIYERLTASDVSMEDRAYHLVALGTVAFHPSVKLFLFEHRPISASVIVRAGREKEMKNEMDRDQDNIKAAVAENTRRREAVVKSVAFFLAQRNNAVAQECRWETAALLGELCRLESLPATRSRGGATILAPNEEIVQKINHYARLNLEYLALLPWFVPAVRELIGNDGSEAVSSSLTVRNTTRLRAKRESDNSDGSPGNAKGFMEDDEDVRVALQDILTSLPDVANGVCGEEKESTDGDVKCGQAIVWPPGRLDQAHDLMFVDASTSMLHLIPLVSRSSHLVCAHCEKSGGATSGSSGDPLLRCSSCKAVYYCSADCQRAHWVATHRVPCKSYKQQVETILAEYLAINKGSNKKKKKQQQQHVTVLEVPLEPSLFYETRRYLYDHRDASFGEVAFFDYFMKYTVRGS
ncbi:MYND finger [Trypanosoma vivax]|uniref:MYND-type domain-containing protein n=1 Tax=Trypanosoma vivax (strain Y486) TaxID=1055687 RepID=G0TZG1_TRYVY|nr:hypothetical protein TRVL_00258 [Trypanosoma vivax]KAH8617034.1 MYND finger [Trypanosoma vivax]CCC49364.1 conserved hypothetical protein [Trypanosoma vivax Y486]